MTLTINRAALLPGKESVIETPQRRRQYQVLRQ
jgi:hypothetical protein